MIRKSCCSRFSLHKFVHLKIFWTQFKIVHLRGLCSLRPCISRPYCTCRWLCFRSKSKKWWKIVLEDTKLVMILLVGSYIFEVKVKNHIREHKTCYNFRCSYFVLEVCTYTIKSDTLEKKSSLSSLVYVKDYWLWKNPVLEICKVLLYLWADQKNFELIEKM